MRFDAVALAVAVMMAGCIPVADMGGVPVPGESPCDDPLPCPDGDPVERFATCTLFECTQVQCDAPTGTRVCSRCWRPPLYRSEVQNGSMWSDGVKWRGCDADGALRASGFVDDHGVPMCADRCDPGHCPAHHGQPLPQCGADDAVD